VDFRSPVNLLHALPARDGKRVPVRAAAIGTRHFILDPYPFAEPSVTIQFPARHVEGKRFSTSAELQKAFSVAPVEMLSVTVTKG
jgi:hypothetical protein